MATSFGFRADRLIELREERELSRETLAGVAQLSFQSIYCYETGRRTPGVGALFAIAHALGVEARDLIDGDLGLVS